MCGMVGPEVVPSTTMTADCCPFESMSGCVQVDMDGFNQNMERQRSRSRAAATSNAAAGLKFEAAATSHLRKSGKQIVLSKALIFAPSATALKLVCGMLLNGHSAAISPACKAEAQ